MLTSGNYDDAIDNAIKPKSNKDKNKQDYIYLLEGL
jgi:hypothetical protein